MYTGAQLTPNSRASSMRVCWTAWFVMHSRPTPMGLTTCSRRWWPCATTPSRISSDQSRGAVVEFFRDPDPRIQYSLIEGAEVAHDERIMTWMQDAIRSPDWTPGAIAVKVAAMKALARMRADGALPLLRRIARTRWVFGQGRRTVRQAARRIVDDWERNRQRPA